MKYKALILFLILVLPLGLALADSNTFQISEGNDDVWITETFAFFPDTAWIRLQDNSIGVSVGLRFQALNIPRYSIINSSVLSVYTDYDLVDSISASATIYGFDTPDIGTFNSSDDLRLPLTTASKTWNISGVEGANTWNNVSITNIVQEIVNKWGWASGNDLGLKIISSPEVERFFNGFEATNPAKLYVTWVQEPITPPSETECRFLEFYDCVSIYNCSDLGTTEINKTDTLIDQVRADAFTRGYSKRAFYIPEYDLHVLVSGNTTHIQIYTAPDGNPPVFTEYGFDVVTTGLSGQAYSNMLSSYLDGARLFVTFAGDMTSDDDLWYTEYDIASNGLVTRRADWDLIDTVGGTGRIKGHAPIVSESGKIFVVWNKAEPYTTQYKTQVSRNSAIDGTWTHYAGYPKTWIDRSFSPDEKYGAIALYPLATDEIAVIYQFDYYLEFVVYDEPNWKWNVSSAITGNIDQFGYLWDASIYSDYDIAISWYQTDWTLHFKLWEYDNQTWYRDKEIYDTVIDRTVGNQLAINSNDITYFIWASPDADFPTTDFVVYEKSLDKGISWFDENGNPDTPFNWFDSTEGLYIGSGNSIASFKVQQENYLLVYIPTNNTVQNARIKFAGLGFAGYGDIAFSVYNISTSVEIQSGFSSLGDARGYAEDYCGTSPDPDDPVWSDDPDYPISKFQTKLMLFLIGFALIFAPLVKMAYERPDVQTVVIAMVLMTLGLGLMLSITYF